MHDNASHPLLAQIPLTVFISLPTATTLPYTYKSIPSTLPSSSTGTEPKSQYVVSSTGHSAHPDDIIASCKALQTYIQNVQNESDTSLKAWKEGIIARDLAEKRRLAPGWLDSSSHGILEPEKKGVAKEAKDKDEQSSLMDMDTSSAESPALRNLPATAGTGGGDELDRAFGGMGL